MSSAPQPFPFASLEALTRDDVTTAARLRRFAREHVRVDTLARALGELVDERVEVLVRRYRRLDATRGADDAVGVVFAMSGDRTASQRVLVEVEGALAATLVTRALKQRAPRITDPARTASPALSGAIAAVLQAALRRAHMGGVPKVLAAGPASALARDLAHAEGGATTAWLTVVVGADAFEARVTVSDLALSTTRAPLDHSSLLAMGEAVLALPLVLTTTLASRADLLALGPGDALVFPTPAGCAEAEGVLRGPVALVPARGERGLAADLAEGGRLVIRGLLESHPWEREMSSSSSATAITTVEVLEDAPVVVRVELGTVSMTAREWAELGPGDVISLGRKLGEPAILRVGGVELARGELVQVDGDYAVRIVARTPGDSE